MKKKIKEEDSIVTVLVRNKDIQTSDPADVREVWQLLQGIFKKLLNQFCNLVIHCWTRDI